MEKRLYSRFPCNIHGEIYIVGSLMSYPMYIKNVSKSGFGVEVIVNPSMLGNIEGQKAVITFDDNRFECKIVRSDATENRTAFMGVTFAPNIITDDVFDNLSVKYAFG